MPGFVKLTDASGEIFYKAIDLIVSFNDVATEPQAPAGARTAVYAGPKANDLALISFPAHWVKEDPETVQALIRSELRRVMGPDGPSVPAGP